MVHHEANEVEARAHKRLQGHPERHIVCRITRDPLIPQAIWNPVTEMLDVTVVGSCLILYEEPRPGEVVHIVFHDHHFDREVQLEGKVNYVEPHEIDTFRVGVSFDRMLSPHELRLLSRLEV